MTALEIANNLERIASTEDFPSRSADLVDAWTAAGAGAEAVEPILRFMEGHPSIDYGAPGALVHFVERFRSKNYQEKLVESIRRKPTSHTIWMLNRLINGTTELDARRFFFDIMEQARLNPLTHQNTILEIDRFLKRLER
jgi:hypothetical protein